MSVTRNILFKFKATSSHVNKGFPHRGSSIVKVPGDVSPARVYFFKLSSLAKGILFANFSPFSLSKGMLFGNLGQRMSNFGNSC